MDRVKVEGNQIASMTNPAASQMALLNLVGLGSQVLSTDESGQRGCKCKISPVREIICPNNSDQTSPGWKIHALYQNHVKIEHIVAIGARGIRMTKEEGQAPPPV